MSLAWWMASGPIDTMFSGMLNAFVEARSGLVCFAVDIGSLLMPTCHDDEMRILAADFERTVEVPTRADQTFYSRASATRQRTR
jgi:hypothetical protein